MKQMMLILGVAVGLVVGASPFARGALCDIDALNFKYRHSTAYAECYRWLTMDEPDTEAVRCQAAQHAADYSDGIASECK